MAPDLPNLTLPAGAAAPSAAGDDPRWYKDAVIYQVHVKAFFDSNGDGIGDFPGLTEKLDYLQSLGVTCLWLLPFFPSPLKDDGYDIADYCNVHPSYGTLEDFEAFVRAAHLRRIRVLIELVINHTSSQHPWFQRARQAPRDSPDREFYVWSDTDQRFPETRVIFLDGEKSNWAFDPVAGQYYWHRFFSHQPDLNHNNPAVVDAVIGVMKFWLDRGVDAMRLDAVPYLCVREGTTNENLPETHAVLKRIRRELDASHPHRMLLAEANQWPADVRAYFGEGDECHMAFHFPLMPRMFMALRQEDRHAIVEILDQTPEIPEPCQWALFLRNHDELTLEMVTDEERDYMYSAYAADPQMRLNTGIRRRLSPLVENSHQRVQLLNLLLFSLPGTPVLYYGDEIGMGDNIYLGDRNGVRTPMQWSSDRNGGFSRADPARLYAPPIQDPVYGFQAINVEAQERYPFSLLNWMKRLIAVRKQHRVLGRGSLQFVDCPNRKVLAYLRRDERETVLVVANLARTIQPAELDLRAFAGLTPVEMVGQTEFPRIGELPYFVTLGPYASYWFTLQESPARIAARAEAPHDPDAAIAAALPTLLLGADWQNLFDGGSRAILERQALRPFLRRQRWFASKAREIRQARFVDWSPLRHGSTPAFLVLVSVDYTDGWTDRYLLPLALLSGEQADNAVAHSATAVLARIAGARKGAIVDGLCEATICDRLLEIVGRGEQQASVHGSIRGTPIGRGIDLTSDRRWVLGGRDQSNSIAFVKDRYALKLFRRIEPATNPELEVGRFLTERGCDWIPAVAGALEYIPSDAGPGTLGIVQTAVKHQGSGWDYTIDELGRFYERVAARIGGSEDMALPAPAGRESPPPFFAAITELYLTTAVTLGRRTGELHLALAGSDAPAFAPEPLDRDALAADLRQDALRWLTVLEERLGALDEATRRTAEEVLARRTAMLARLDRVRTLADPGLRIRIHGDYHLGQVLRTEEDFVILDFEGEPARPIAERRAKQSPMKDVAGMLRSYSYAAYAALFARAARDEERAPLEPWADLWQHWASDAFLRGYRLAIGDSPVAPRGASFEALLDALRLDKALYELGYELNNRPEWVRVPLAGILKLD